MLKAVVELVSTNKNKIGNYSKKVFNGGVDFYYKNVIVASLCWRSKTITYANSSNIPVKNATKNYKEYLEQVFSEFEHIVINY